jgi:hypothetical protein
MIAALQDYRRIWRVTTLQRAPRMVALFTWMALLMALGATVLVGIGIARHRLSFGVAPRVLAVIALFWLTCTWINVFVPGSILLNSAANARLLPRQRRRLQQMAGGGWLLLTLAIPATIGNWSLLPMAGMYLLAFGLMGTGSHALLTLAILACNVPWLAFALLPPAVMESATSRTGLLVQTALLVLAAAWVLRRLYPAAGDAHLARRETELGRMRRLQELDWGKAAQGKGLLSNWSGRLYASALRRDCRAAVPGRMLMHALGPTAHWSAWASSLAVMLAAGIGLHLAFPWSDRAPLLNAMNGPSGAGLAMLILVLFSTAQFSQQIRRTRGEQALLRLTPLAGSAALLNRRLATQLLLRALGNWLMLTAVSLLVIALIGGDRMVLLRLAGLCCLAGQVAMMGLLGNYAADGGWDLSLGLRAGLLAILQAAVALGLARLSGISYGPCLAAVAIGAAVFQLRRSWRAMLAAPVAFPARRMDA